MNKRDAMMSQFWSKLDESPFLMVGTFGVRMPHEPMTAYFDADYPNRLFIFTRKDNRLVKSMVGPTEIVAEFVSKGNDFFASLRGRPVLTTDKALIDRFWSKGVEAWYDGGKDDPMLQLMYVDLQYAELWEADRSLLGRLKQTFGGKVDSGRGEDNHIQAHL